MKSLVTRMAQSSVARNALAFFGARAFTFLLPLVTVPYLARMLGSEIWGKVVFVQVLGIYIAMIIDYSFPVSATRDVARSRDDSNQLAGIVSGVLGVKGILFVASAGLLAIAQLLVPTLRDNGWFLWLALYWALGVAFIPVFYFQGIEAMPRLLKVDIPLKVAGTASIFLLVKSPADAWLALFLPASAGVLITFITGLMLYRNVPFRLPAPGQTISTLREGWQIFAYRLAASLYWMSNSIILGLVAPIRAVGLFAGPERITRAIINVTDPISQALFPHSAKLAKTDQARLARVATITTVAMAGLGLIGALMLYVMAPLVVRVALGPGFEESIPVLRILAFILPVCGISMSLNMQWMFPLGMDRAMMWIAIGGAVFHVPLAIVLALQYQHIGISVAYLITESGIALAVIGTLFAKRLLPFTLHWSTGPRLAFRKESP